MKGHELKHIRKKLYMRQIDLAKKLGVTQSMISQWESDDLPMSAAMIKRVREMEGEG